ncbi:MULTISPECIES: multicopper oxidase domain-containing protein [unclassified Luteococcus]|uniref:multicopper oxidase domain-containing protein n=1 Tax=unclassified Luteococcus TaxID=2639923 RepID=UPI00313B28D6
MDIVKGGGAAHPTRRDWHTRAALPLVLWALGAVVLVGAHRFVPRAIWLMVHFVTLGIASNAIVVWSNHFADAVLRTAPRGHRREASQLALLNAALVLLSTGVVGQWAIPVWLGVVLLLGMAGIAVVGLGRQAKASLPSRFGMTVAWYRWAAVSLAVGVVLGGLMAVPFGRWADELLASHLAFNILGWVGLTVWGTLTTLWPTMLRTRAGEGVERAVRSALPFFLLGILACGLAPWLAGFSPVWWRLVGALGTVVYLTGVATQLVPVAEQWRSKRTTSFAVLSVAAGQLWFCLWLGWMLWHWMASSSPAQLVGALRGTVPALLVGFLLQVVIGALSYLVPVVLGGGPAMVRATTAVFERGAIARLGMVNLSLALFCLPIASVWKVTTSTLAFVGLTLFLPLLVRAWRLRRAGAPPQVSEPRPHRIRRGLLWALVWSLVAAGLAAAVDPVSFRGQFGARSLGSDVAATGQTTAVTVVAENMRFTPDVIQVPRGNRLEITVENRDAGMIHDLVLASGATSGRLSPGQSAVVDAGVVASSADGWCSVAGHRQLGMVLRIEVAGESAAPAAGAGHAHQATNAAEADGRTPSLDLSKQYSEGWKPRDATLPPAAKQKLHRVTMRVTNQEVEVAPGVRQTLWTFNQTAPGPVLRGKLGDVFEITLVNDGDMGHGIDFHAGALAPDQPMRTIAPGESLVYRFTAKRAGIWMYHCSTMPMTQHIANGMYGAVVIDPPDLPPVDREYLLVQGEQYYGADADGRPGVADMSKIMAERPDAVVFNGYPAQYDKSPLAARVGERVRFWVLDAGPQRAWAFHIVGAQFDSVWFEGSWRLKQGVTPGVPGAVDGGSQTLGMLASQGGFVETVFPEAGHYAMVNHQMVDAERGAHGIVQVR